MKESTIIAREKTTQPQTEPHAHTKLKLEHIEQKLGGKKRRKKDTYTKMTSKSTFKLLILNLKRIKSLKVHNLDSTKLQAFNLDISKPNQEPRLKPTLYP